jgi:phosphoribosylformylglycinamidine cyclo-ligase
MCVNDCLCVGAQPLFFLDYLAMAQDDPEQHYALVKGVRDGCLLAQAALIGGETAIMPGLYAPGDFDLAGFCVGVVERTKMIDGSGIRPGDVLIGVASTGLHSNGFSLVRKAVFDAAELTVDEHVPELGATVGEVLLTPTRIYADITSRLLNDAALREGITGIAHITGGGLADNVVRILPEGRRAVIDRARWNVPAVFSWVQRLGSIEREEMYRVFNMGVGLVLVCRADVERQVHDAIAESNTRSFRIGEVTSGPQAADYVH